MTIDDREDLYAREPIEVDPNSTHLWKHHADVARFTGCPVASPSGLAAVTQTRHLSLAHFYGRLSASLTELV